MPQLTQPLPVGNPQPINKISPKITLVINNNSAIACDVNISNGNPAAPINVMLPGVPPVPIPPAGYNTGPIQSNSFITLDLVPTPGNPVNVNVTNNTAGANLTYMDYFHQ